MLTLLVIATMDKFNNHNTGIIMYYILIDVSYYKTTLNAPKSGALTDDYGEKLIFYTIDEAKQYLKSIGISCQVTPQSFKTNQGEHYRLKHGQYAPDLYLIRKIAKSRG